MSKAEELLGFIEWHKKEYGHAYNHNNNLIETAKKATRYSNYIHQSRVNAISDEDIDDMFPLKPTDGTEQTTSFNTATIQARGGAKLFKNKLLKQ